MLALPAAGLAQPLPAPAQAAPPSDHRVTHQVAPGIQHVQLVREDPAAPLVVNVLRANLRQAGWHLQVSSAQDVMLSHEDGNGRDAVGNIALKRGALAGINGDFFPWTGDPVGLQITDGELCSDPYPGRSAFGITRDGRTLWGPVQLKGTVTIGGHSFAVTGVNRRRGENDLILYTPRFAATTYTNWAGTEVTVEWLSGPLRPGVEVKGTVSSTAVGAGNSRIPANAFVLSGHGTAAKFLKQASAGDGVSVRVDLSGEDNQPWNEAWQAVGGGPRLLRKGEVCVNAKAEGFASDVARGRAPRSAVAVTAGGELLLATVDGRQSSSRGMTLQEWAEWLRSEGAVDAINLDGGGSTTFALRRLVANSPSEGNQRLVANSLLVMLDAEQPDEPGELVILPPASAPDPARVAVTAPAAGATAAEGPAGPGPAPAEGPAAAAATPAGPATVPAGSHLRFRVARRLPDGKLQELPEDAVTWSVRGKGLVVEQDGIFYGTHPVSAVLVASTGKQVARAEVAIVPGPPALVEAGFDHDADTGAPGVWARVLDAYRNPVEGAAVRLTYKTPAGPQVLQATTGAKGTVWVPLPETALAAGDAVSVETGTAPAALVKLPPPAAAEDAAGKLPKPGAGPANDGAPAEEKR